jgi:hypothetical protein
VDGHVRLHRRHRVALLSRGSACALLGDASRMRPGVCGRAISYTGDVHNRFVAPPALLELVPPAADRPRITFALAPQPVSLGVRGRQLLAWRLPCATHSAVQGGAARRDEPAAAEMAVA